MDVKAITNAVSTLELLAEIMNNSQKFGQSLPAGTTKIWGTNLVELAGEIRAGLSAEPKKEVNIGIGATRPDFGDASVKGEFVGGHGGCGPGSSG